MWAFPRVCVRQSQLLVSAQGPVILIKITTQIKRRGKVDEWYRLFCLPCDLLAYKNCLKVDHFF